MGVREAWDAFCEFETLAMRPNDLRKPLASFLREWEQAGDRLAAAAPGCRYPDLLVAFKLLYACRPEQAGERLPTLNYY